MNGNPLARNLMIEYTYHTMTWRQHCQISIGYMLQTDREREEGKSILQGVGKAMENYVKRGRDSSESMALGMCPTTYHSARFFMNHSKNPRHPLHHFQQRPGELFLLSPKLQQLSD